MSKSYCILAWTSTFVAAVALSPVLILASDKPNLPRREEVIHRLVERAKAWKDKDESEEKHLSYSERVVTNKLQADGALKDREEKIYQVAPVNGEPTPKLVQKNGKPPSPSDLKEEHERLRKERGASQKRKDSGAEITIELFEAPATLTDCIGLREGTHKIVENPNFSWVCKCALSGAIPTKSIGTSRDSFSMAPV